MELFDREAAITAIKSYCANCDTYGGKHRMLCGCAQEILDKVDEVPTVDAVEVVHGKWIHGCECSVCHRTYGPRAGTFAEHYHFCTWCGAKMDAKDTNVPTSGGEANEDA